MSVSGLNRLKARIAKMPGAVKAAAKAANDTNADELVEMMQRLAPVESGTLRKSIRKKSGATETGVKIVAGGASTTKKVRKGVKDKDAAAGNGLYDYALAQEFGTRRQKAQPFFFPAYRSLKKRLKSRVGRAAGKAIKDAAGQ